MIEGYMNIFPWVILYCFLVGKKPVIKCCCQYACRFEGQSSWGCWLCFNGVFLWLELIHQGLLPQPLTDICLCVSVGLTLTHSYTSHSQYYWQVNGDNIGPVGACMGEITCIALLQKLSKWIGKHQIILIKGDFFVLKSRCFTYYVSSTEVTNLVFMNSTMGLYYDEMCINDTES